MPFIPVEYDAIGTRCLKGEEHAEPVTVGEADSVAVDVVHEQGMADKPRHFDVDLFLALTAAKLQSDNEDLAGINKH